MHRHLLIEYRLKYIDFKSDFASLHTERGLTHFNVGWVEVHTFLLLGLFDGSLLVLFWDFFRRTKLKGLKDAKGAKGAKDAKGANGFKGGATTATESKGSTEGAKKKER